MITHRNRREDVYYLHEGRTKTGKPKYYFSRKKDGVLANALPAGFEIYESPNAQVLLRKIILSLVTHEETNAVSDAVQASPGARRAIVEPRGDAITVFMPDRDPDAAADELAAGFPLADRENLVRSLERSLLYSPMMRFVLFDAETREFQTERWCYLGSVDDWMPVGSPGPLAELVREYCPHLGEESFFELL